MMIENEGWEKKKVRKEEERVGEEIGGEEGIQIICRDKQGGRIKQWNSSVENKTG